MRKEKQELWFKSAVVEENSEWIYNKIFWANAKISVRCDLFLSLLLSVSVSAFVSLSFLKQKNFNCFLKKSILCLVVLYSSIRLTDLIIHKRLKWWINFNIIDSILKSNMERGPWTKECIEGVILIWMCDQL